MPKQKAAEALFDQLSKTLETDGEDLVSKLKVRSKQRPVPADMLGGACIMMKPASNRASQTRVDMLA